MPLAFMIILLTIPFGVIETETPEIVSGGVYTLTCAGKNPIVSADKNGAAVSADTLNSSWTQRFVLGYDASENAPTEFIHAQRNRTKASA